jgi:hypothetical protein
MKPLRHASHALQHFLSGTRQRKYAKCALLQLPCGTTKQKNVSHALKASLYGTQVKKPASNAKFQLLFGTRL